MRAAKAWKKPVKQQTAGRACSVEINNANPSGRQKLKLLGVPGLRLGSIP